MTIPHDLEVSTIIFVKEGEAYKGLWLGNSPYVWVTPDLIQEWNELSVIVPGIDITLADFILTTIAYDEERDRWLLECVNPPIP